MNDKQPLEKPYLAFGRKMQALRLKKHESVDDVSGAVEIEADLLVRIENGEQRPSEDILMLLITHFDVKDEDATVIWDLADYDKPTDAYIPITEVSSQPIAMLVPYDTRVVYTDRVHVAVNNYGVIMNFMQLAGPQNQPLAVARIGMSREHAQSVLDVLQQTLDQAASQQSTKSLPKTQKDNKLSDETS